MKRRARKEKATSDKEMVEAKRMVRLLVFVLIGKFQICIMTKMVGPRLTGFVEPNWV